jgi:hypothetical protein
VSRELEGRNQAMYQMYATGKTIQVIADTFGITRQRASQIISRYGQDAEVTEDETRDLHRAQLEALRSEMLGLAFAPAPPAYDVKGNMLIDENGDPVRDIAAKVKAAEAFMKLSESERKMDALDKPRRKQLTEDVAMQQLKAYLATLPKADVIQED